MTKNLFSGTGVALITPFRKQGGTIDFSKLGRVIEYIIDGGVDYIVVLGTTSEAATLTALERSTVQDYVRETVNDRVPLMLGMGGNDTQAVVDTINTTSFDGINGILSVTPYYNKPLQKGLLQHFHRIAEASPVPVVVYNVPGRTGCNLMAETTLQLAEESNIIAIKEASGNLQQIMEILRHKPENFQVISGDDSLTYPMMCLGASGVISVLANALPKHMSQMVSSARKGDYRKALNLHNAMLPLMRSIFDEGNPTGVKALMEAMNAVDNSTPAIANTLRSPLVKASKELSSKLKQQYLDFAGKKV